MPVSPEAAETASGTSRKKVELMFQCTQAVPHKDGFTQGDVFRRHGETIRKGGFCPMCRLDFTWKVCQEHARDAVKLLVDLFLMRMQGSFESS